MGQKMKMEGTGLGWSARRRRLSVKFVVPTAIVLAIIQLGGAVLIRQNQSRQIEQDLRTMGQALVDSMAAISTDFMVNLDTVALEGVAKNVIKQQAIRSAVIRDAQGKDLTIQRASADGARIIQFSKPMQDHGKTIGYVEIGLSTASMDKALVDLAMVLVVSTALLMFAMVIAIGMLASRMVIRPLGRMTDVAQLLAKGDFSQNIDHRSNDEIGTLADSFRELVRYVTGLSDAADGLSKGDLSMNVLPKSDADCLSRNFMKAKSSLEGLLAETQELIQAAQQGRLEARGRASRFDGVYRSLIEAVNQMMDAAVAPINEATGTLERVAARDLTARMAGDYKGDYSKIKDSLNTALINLNEGLAQVAVTAEQVSSASTGINSSSQHLAQNTSQQAETLEEITASLQEVASMIKQNAFNAQEARGLSEKARTSAERGASNMQRLSAAVQKIKSSSDQTAAIVKTIDAIAFQTNLLALNAAVEAARAGDAGRGFAVVAEEVRNLAMRSAEASKSTGQLIEESVRNADDGVSLNREVVANLEEIQTQVTRVSEVMTEIASGSEQQSQGVDQITQGINLMNGVTQQNATSSRESAGAADDLSEQARAMQQLVDSFVLGELNGHSPRGLPPGSDLRLVPARGPVN